MPMLIVPLVQALVVALITTAITMAVGMITKSLTKKKKTPARKAGNKAQENKQNITETTTDLPIIYGRSRIGCSQVFISQKFAYAGTTTRWEQGQEIEFDTRGEYLYIIAAICIGEIDDIEQTYIDGIPITNKKFSNGYRNNLTFSWSFAEPNPITLTTVDVQAALRSYRSNYYLLNQGYVYDSTQNVLKKAISYQPKRYRLSLIVAGKKNQIISFVGGTQSINLQNAGYGSKQYILEYLKDNGAIVIVGQGTVNLTQDNADFTQPVNNNLTITQNSYLASKYLQIEEKKGTLTQTANNYWLAQGVPYYTDNARGKNVALCYFRGLLRTAGPDIDKAPLQGIPVLTFDIRGKKVLDPRTNFKVYSNNPILCLLDYMLDSLYYGCKIELEDVDLDSFIEEANHCDELITAQDGITQIKRYVINGVIDTTNETIDNIIDILEVCNGTLFNDFGKWKVYIEKPETSDWVFNLDNMIGSVSITTGEFRSKINTIHTTFINEKTNWEGDVITITNDIFVQQDLNKVFDTELQLPFTNDYDHAYYLTLFKLKSARLDKQITFTTFWDSVELLPGSVVSIDRADLGFNNKLFRIKEIEPDNENGLLKIVASEYDDDVYNNLNIDPEANNIISGLASAFDVEPPSNVQVKQTFEFDVNNNYYTQTRFEWTPSPSINIRNYTLEYRTFGWGDWVKLGTAQNTTVIFNNIPTGLYDFRIKATNDIGADSEYYEEIIEIFAPTARPQDVTNFNIGSSSNEFVLRWNLVPEVANNGFYIIRHTRNLISPTWNDVLTFEIMVPGYQTSITTSQIDGTYMIKAVNSAGLMSVNNANLTLDSPYDSEYVLIQSISENPSFSGEILNYPISLTNILQWKGEDLLWKGQNLQWTEDIGIQSMSINNGILSLSNTLTWDSLDQDITWDQFDPSLTWDSWNNSNVLIGVYNFANGLDLGGVYKIVLEKNIIATSFDSTGTTWDQLDSSLTWAQFDQNQSWDQYDGNIADAPRLYLYVRYTRDNPSNSPSWTEWQLLTKNEFVCHACQFKLEVISPIKTTNILISGLSIKVWMRSRVDQVKVLYDTENQNILFNKPFYQLPATTSITINNPDNGDYTSFNLLTESGFNANIYDSNNQIVSRMITSTTYGVGERII